MCVHVERWVLQDLGLHVAFCGGVALHHQRKCEPRPEIFVFDTHPEPVRFGVLKARMARAIHSDAFLKQRVVDYEDEPFG